MGSRACKANHYVIAVKCPVCPYVPLRRASIERSLELSENAVTHTELLKINISFFARSEHFLLTVICIRTMLRP